MKKNSEIILFVKFKVKEIWVQDFKKELAKLTEYTRSEDKCLNFNPSQNTKRPTEFILYEKWQDDEGLKNHEQTEHLQKFVSTHSQFLSDKPEVIFCKEILES